jgi:hypothetical protein
MKMETKADLVPMFVKILDQLSNGNGMPSFIE